MKQNIITLARDRLTDDGVYRLSEYETKRTIIEPLLRRLGWDMESYKEVRTEYRIENGRVDYAIFSGPSLIFLLEAKHAQSMLNGYEGQILNYAQNAGAIFAVLTNGIEWRIFVKNKRLPIIDLKTQDLGIAIDTLIQYLSKPNVVRGNHHLDELMALAVVDENETRPVKNKQPRAQAGPAKGSKINPTSYTHHEASVFGFPTLYDFGFTLLLRPDGITMNKAHLEAVEARAEYTKKEKLDYCVRDFAPEYQFDLKTGLPIPSVMKNMRRVASRIKAVGQDVITENPQDAEFRTIDGKSISSSEAKYRRGKVHPDKVLYLIDLLSKKKLCELPLQLQKDLIRDYDSVIDVDEWLKHNIFIE